MIAVPATLANLAEQTAALLAAPNGVFVTSAASVLSDIHSNAGLS
jgi:hypothetical protein